MLKIILKRNIYLQSLRKSFQKFIEKNFRPISKNYFETQYFFAKFAEKFSEVHREKFSSNAKNYSEMQKKISDKNFYRRNFLIQFDDINADFFQKFFHICEKIF